jgi:hypothetical protein
MGQLGRLFHPPTRVLIRARVAAFVDVALAAVDATARLVVMNGGGGAHRGEHQMFATARPARATMPALPLDGTTAASSWR